MNRRARNATRQRGITTVEVAVVGAVAMITMFAVLEIGRALFVWNFLEEATRRGARAAAVCQVGDGNIGAIAAYTRGGGASALINGLTPANFSVEYLDQGGNIVGDTTANYGDIEFVRVSLTNFQHQVLIPYATQILTAPTFATTLPRESLGVSRDGITAC